MPRSNRPHRRRGVPETDDSPELDLDQLFAGRPRVERRRDGAWNVQGQRASTAVKSYTCPGCGLEIAPGTAHLVAWRADGIMGEADDLAQRRHWHPRCWRIGP